MKYVSNFYLVIIQVNSLSFSLYVWPLKMSKIHHENILMRAVAYGDVKQGVTLKHQ